MDAILRSAWLDAHDKYKLTASISNAVKRVNALAEILARSERRPFEPYPRYILKLRAQRMGLTYDARHKWTAAEERYLLNNAGRISIKAMMKVLPHGYSKIMAKIHSMGMRYGIKEGMSMADLSEALGVAHRTVKQWDEAGLIKRRSGRYSDTEVATFVKRHPELYDLRRVHQDWFKALMFPNADCFDMRQECAA